MTKCLSIIIMMFWSTYGFDPSIASSGAIISKANLLDQAAKIRSTITLISSPSSSSSITTTTKSAEEIIKCFSSASSLSYPTYYYQNNLTKRGFSNWLLPNKIMIGQYPSSQTPDIHDKIIKNVECTQNHLDSLIIKDNIRLFCCLQDEIPAQDDYHAWMNAGSKNTRRSGGKVYLDDNRDFPYYFEHYEPLVQKSFAKVKKGSNGNEIRDQNDDGSFFPPKFVYKPIIDLSAPSSRSLYSTLSTLLDALENRPSHAIYIHCWGGRGRAGLIGSCLLSLLFPELNAIQVLEWTQRGYDTRIGAESMPFGLKQSPQTSAQREFVRKFVDDIQKVEHQRVEN